MTALNTGGVVIKYHERSSFFNVRSRLEFENIEGMVNYLFYGDSGYYPRALGKNIFLCGMSFRNFRKVECALREKLNEIHADVKIYARPNLSSEVFLDRYSINLPWFLDKVKDLEKENNSLNHT